MFIKDLKKEHPNTYRRIEEETIRQGGTFDENKHVHNTDGFMWEKSIEGHYIWSNVDRGRFDSFYEFHKDSRLDTEIKEGDLVKFKDRNSINAKYFKKGLLNLKIKEVYDSSFSVYESDESQVWNVLKDEVELMNSTEEELTDHEILEEAKRRYSEGTIHLGSNISGKNADRESNRFIVKGELRFSSGIIHSTSNGAIYVKGNENPWAVIVEKKSSAEEGPFWKPNNWHKEEHGKGCAEYPLIPEECFEKEKSKFKEIKISKVSIKKRLVSRKLSNN